MSTKTTESAAADTVAAPLDLLLTDAALGMLNRVNPGGSGLRLAAALATRPRLVAGRTRNLLGELTRIAAGTSQVQPSRRDRRFTDPGWAGNPLLRRAMQVYLAAARTAEGLTMDANLDWCPDGADRQPGTPGHAAYPALLVIALKALRTWETLSGVPAWLANTRLLSGRSGPGQIRRGW